MKTLDNTLKLFSNDDDILTTTMALTAQHFSLFATNGDNAQEGGIYVRLFEPLLVGTESEKSFTRSEHADHGEIGGARWWRPVYYKDGILTLWMADPYRDFAHGAAVYEPYPLVRNALLTDFMGVTDGTIASDQGVLSNFPESVRDIIVKPNNVSSHINQPATTNGDVVYVNNANGEDLIWLPSLYELFGPLTTGASQSLWKVSTKDRAYSKGNFQSLIWSRSTFYRYSVAPAWSVPGGSYATGMAEDVGSANAFVAWWYNAGGTAGGPVQVPASSIRPAIHINLTGLSFLPHISAEIE